MSKKRAGKSSGEVGGINMTPMIDVVFQMIIFFITTIDLDKKKFDERIKLSLAPHGKAVEKKDPRTMIVDVNEKGQIGIANTYMDTATFTKIMANAVSRYGQTMPVVIRGDGRTRHRDIRRVLDVCSRVGLWKVKFAAIKDPAIPVE
jgi:biopolymer transport protein ExbD